jgi:hypothetical protein
MLSNKTQLGHCFLLTDLSEVLHKDVGSRQRSRLRKRERLCLRCFGPDFRNHVTTCHTGQSRSGSELFRPTRNRFRHEPWVKDAMTGLPRRNELGFAKGQLHKCLKPLYIAAVDFEAANVSIVGTATTPPEQPKGAIFRQTALGWGVAYRALYGHLPLPEELDSVRMQFLKEDETAAVGGDDDASCRRGVLSNEDRLILTLLETIREDAYLIGA